MVPYKEGIPSMVCDCLEIYSPKCLEEEFSEVRLALIQHPGRPWPFGLRLTWN
jgi:hypothetical protein